MIPAIPFTKMVGTGNDFLIVDTVHGKVGARATRWPVLSRLMCNRRHGVGADGVLVLEPSRLADCKMRVFNADGSEAEMCGNGARCVAWFVHRLAGRRRQEVSIETAGGVVRATVRGERVQMRMPDPKGLRPSMAVKVAQRCLQVGAVNTGVPHIVVPVAALDDVDVDRLGRQLRFHRAFRSRGTNVNFLETDARRPNRLRIRTYERGVEGETLACGTGVTAAAVLHALNGPRRNKARVRRIEVETRGGERLIVTVTIAPSRTDGASHVTNVTLEGPVRTICQGVFTPSRLAVSHPTSITRRTTHAC